MDADKDAAHLAAKLSTFLEQQLQGFEKKTKISRQKKSRSAPILGHIDPLPKPKADRARPIKPHENSPFLGINLLPPEKQAAEAAEPSQLRQKSNRLNVPLSRPGSTTTRATRASQTGRVTSAASTRRVPSRQSRAAAYGSVAGDFIKFPNAVPFHKSPVVTVHPKANKHIKSPFKQNANTIELEVSNVAPGQDLKEKTALATYHVSRVLAQQPVKQEIKHFGRLRKGKLKPLLEPVVLDGPSIEQCRGIVADAHCYMASPSKSSLRREQLLNSLTKDYIRERPRTAESMHHTSEASDTEDRQRELEEDYDDFEEEEPEDEDYVDYDVELDENVVPPNGYNVDMSHIPGAEMSEENLMTAEQEKESDINNLRQMKESPEQDIQVPTEAVLGVTVTNQQKPRVGSAKTILRDPNRPVTATEESGRRGSAKTVRFKDFSSEADTKAGGDMLVQQVTSSLVIEQSEATSPQGLSHSDTAQSSNEKSDSKVSEQGDVIKEEDQGQKNDVNTGAEHSVPNSETTTDSQGVTGIESLKEVAVVEEKSETDDKKTSGKVSCKDDVVDESVKKDGDDDNDDDLSHNPSNQNDGKSSTSGTQAPASGGNDSITDRVNGGTNTNGGGNSDCKEKQNTDNQRKESGSELSGKIDERAKQNPNVITQEQFQSYIRGHAEMALQFSQFLIDKNHYQKFTRRPNSASMNVRSRPSSGKKDSLRKRPLSAGANKCNSSSQNQGRASPRRTQRPGSSSSAGKRPGSRIGFTSPDRPGSPEKDQRWVSTSKSQKSSPRKVDSLKPTVSKPPTGAENKQLKTGRRSRTHSQQKKLSPKKENLHLKQGDIFLHSSRVSDPMSNSRTGHGTRESSRANLHIDLSNIDDEGLVRAYTMDHETYEGACGICGLEADMCICPNSTLKSNHGEIAKAPHDEILEDFDDDELGIYEDSGESDAESENVDTILTLEEMENSLSQVQLDINRKCVGLEKMNRIIESSFSMGEYDIEGMEDPDMLKLDIDSVIKEMAPEVISGGAASYREDTERFWMSTDCKRLLASYRYKCMTGGTDCAEMSSSLVVPNSNRHDDGAEDTVVFLSSRKQDGITEEKVLYSSRQEKQMDTIDLVARETTMRNQGSAETSIHERKASQSDQPKSCQSLAWNQSCDNVSDSGCGSEVEQSLLDDYEGLSRGGSAADSVVDKDDAESKNKVSTPAEEDSRPDVTGLKVIATTKTLSAPSRCDKNLEDDHTPVAPYPPICFRINAKPPEGHMYYFAYGTDMNPNRFGTYVRKKACTRLWGLLFGFQLKFNKRGADIEAGGFPNIEFNPFSSVEGVVYTITQSELALLDQCTGYPEHYEHVMVPVWMCNSSDPSTLGVAQYCVPAVTYVAQDKWITREDYPLEFEYNLHQCLKSCDMLSPAYKQHLFQMQGSAQVW